MSPFASDRRSPYHPGRLTNLFIHPRQFFSDRTTLSKPINIVIAAWIVGLAGTFDRIDYQIARVELTGNERLQRSLALFIDSWSTFWPFVLVIGAIGGGLIWLIWGWWFHQRIKFCTVATPETNATPNTTPDIKVSRQVFIYAALIASLPQVLFMAFWTVRYDDYIDAYNQGTFLSLVVVFLAFWELFTAYIAVRTVFKVDRWRARCWFIIAPAILYLIQFGLFTLLYALAP